MPTMLEGKGQPLKSLAVEVASTAILLMVAVPVVVTSGGMILLGFTALADPGRIGSPGLFLAAGFTLGVAFIPFAYVLI